MVTAVDPESMTSEERQLEVASILARGLLRCILLARTADSSPQEKVSKKSQNGLDLSREHTRGPSGNHELEVNHNTVLQLRNAFPSPRARPSGRILTHDTFRPAGNWLSWWDCRRPAR